MVPAPLLCRVAPRITQIVRAEAPSIPKNPHRTLPKPQRKHLSLSCLPSELQIAAQGLGLLAVVLIYPKLPCCRHPPFLSLGLGVRPALCLGLVAWMCVCAGDCHLTSVSIYICVCVPCCAGLPKNSSWIGLGRLSVQKVAHLRT